MKAWNTAAQAYPTTYIETPTAEGLWAAVERECLAAGNGCDALLIPHNSNVSNGRMFTSLRSDGTPLDAAGARQRAKLETLVEVTQHKGDSECRAGAADELCSYEKLSVLAGEVEAVRAEGAAAIPQIDYREILAGGYVGRGLASFLSAYLNKTGSIILILTLLFLSIVLSTQFSFGRLFAAIFQMARDRWTAFLDSRRARAEERRREKQRQEVLKKHLGKDGKKETKEKDKARERDRDREPELEDDEEELPVPVRVGARMMSRLWRKPTGRFPVRIHHARQ